MPDGQAQAVPADPDGTSLTIIHMLAIRHGFRSAIVNNGFILPPVDNEVDNLVNHN